MWWTLLACWNAPAPGPEPVASQHPDDNASKPKIGRWNRARGPSAEIEALEAIGYVGGVEEGRGWVGVTKNTANAASGVNLYVSGHAPEAVLMDLDGTELHRWSLPFSVAFPDRKVPKGVRGSHFWRRAALLDDGGLLAIYEGQGLLQLDKDSKKVWAWEGRAHHDLQVLPDGRIWVLSRKAHVVPEVHATKPVLEDFVTLLDTDGQVLEQHSVLAAIRSSAPELLERMPVKSGDIFHTNSLQVLEADGPLGPGLLLSSRALSAIFVLDPATGQISWSHTGEYAKQHDPQVLPDGSLMLFDNLGPAGEQSAVRMYDLPSMQPAWTYQKAPFFTRFCGAAQRLSNGNTLIVESGVGHAFEVDAAGAVVWDFYNPARTGEDDAFVAILPDLIRVPRPGWLPTP